jgi:hypothetical protein
MTPRSRLLLLVAAVAVLVIAFVIAQGSGDDDEAGKNASATQTVATATTEEVTTATEGSGTATATTTTPAPKPKPSVPVVRVVDGEPQGGVKRLSFEKGDRIRFRVVSDVADEIHVHGYDFMKDVKAGGTVSFSFPAKIDGEFEIELEGRAEQIASLTVQP